MAIFHATYSPEGAPPFSTAFADIARHNPDILARIGPDRGARSEAHDEEQSTESTASGDFGIEPGQTSLSERVINLLTRDGQPYEAVRLLREAMENAGEYDIHMYGAIAQGAHAYLAREANYDFEMQEARQGLEQLLTSFGMSPSEYDLQSLQNELKDMENIEDLAQELFAAESEIQNIGPVDEEPSPNAIGKIMALQGMKEWARELEIHTKTKGPVMDPEEELRRRLALEAENPPPAFMPAA